MEALIATAALVLVGILILSFMRQGPVDGERGGASKPSAPSAGARLSYEQSCRYLQRIGLLPEGEPPPLLPAGRPSYEDEEPGLSFYRTKLSGVALENLTIRRTFIGRSGLEDVSFRGSDLSESTLCWNDLTRVDFTGADLWGADLRASDFEGVSFEGADLRGADLRRSDFASCSFESARLDGALLTRADAERMGLQSEQVTAVAWQDSDGPEPPGG